MTIPIIPNHVVTSLKRLLEQYKNQPNLTAVISIYLQQVQDLEDSLYPLFQALNITVMEGAMLDLIGELVGKPRTTNDDAQYRILLYVKIHQNVSEGEVERVISVFRLLTASPYVHNINLGQGEVQVQVTNPIATQEEIDLIYREAEKVLADGVRLGVILYADPDEAFAYDGADAPAACLGYDDGTMTVGGMYADHYLNRTPFEYAGSDDGSIGYGAGSLDSLAGGAYVD